MDEARKLLSSAFGIGVAGLLFLFIAWMIFGGFVKIFAPQYLGYETIGWKHAGAQSSNGFSTPKWAGLEGFASAFAAPLRQYKVYMKKGDRLIVDYDFAIERGAVSIKAYRTNFSLLLQGPLVEHHRHQHFKKGRHQGVFEYVAPRDGFYEFDYDIWWDKDDNRDKFLPLPNYELVYDLRWRLQKGAHRATQRAGLD